MQDGSERSSTSKSRLIRAAILIVILVVGMAVVWFGFRFALGTSTPFFVVSSGSMVPALNVGDIIIVQDSDTFEAIVEGDIIVFERPMTKDRIIVHRAHDIIQDNEGLGFITKGDFNPSPDSWIVREDGYVGKVVFSIPYIGLVTSWLTPPYNYMLIVVILILIFFTEFGRGGKKEIASVDES